MQQWRLLTAVVQHLYQKPLELWKVVVQIPIKHTTLLEWYEEIVIDLYLELG